MMRFETDRKSTHGWLGGLVLVLAAALAAPGWAGEPFWIETVQTKQRYEVETLGEYAFVYIDRDFVFTSVPGCLKGSRYIATANSDKFSRGPDFLRLRSEVPVAVYVGYDRRYRTMPDWLTRRFRAVPDLELAMGDPKLGKTQVVYGLHRAEFAPGRIELGGNLAETEKSNYAMYTAVIVEASEDRCQ